MNSNLQDQLLKIVIDQALESKLNQEGRNALRQLFANGYALYQAFQKQQQNQEPTDPAFDFRDMQAYSNEPNDAQPDETLRPKPVSSPQNDTSKVPPNWLLCLSTVSSMLPKNAFPCS